MRFAPSLAGAVSLLSLLLVPCQATNTTTANSTTIAPNITLPWGTYQATNITGNETFWHFPNIRYGQDTSGANRFKLPLTPTSITSPNVTIVNSSVGDACVQVPPQSLCSTQAAPITGSEDCLFLDVYVPVSVNRSLATTPVVVWFYGGAFVFGSKDEGAPFYTGRGLIEAVAKLGKEVIFVAGNYRLGGFGWLAGPTMQAYGVPNLGIADQAAIFAWVQEYIHLVGGNSSDVSAWGESAGASSIMHHLIKQDTSALPFRKALLQSPAFEWQWDNSTNGTMESIFAQFAKLAGCGSGNGEAQFACLQKRDVNYLRSANAQLYNFYAARSLFPYGPAVDNGSLPLLAPIALQAGLMKPLDALVVSHVYNESGTFTPNITTETQYEAIIDYNFVPGTGAVDTKVKNDIFAQYPVSAFDGDQRARLETTIRDVCFTCNTRYLYDAYTQIPGREAKEGVYMMQYSLGQSVLPQADVARHGSDLLPAFWYESWNATTLIQNQYCTTAGEASLASSALQNAAPAYQQYLASFAVSDSPNAASPAIPWQLASNDSDKVLHVLNFGQEFDVMADNNYTDTQNTWTACGEFWLEQAKLLVQAAKDGEASAGSMTERSMGLLGVMAAVAVVFLVG